MTNQPVDLKYCLTLKPEKALKYFEDKGYILPKSLSEGWQDVWQEAHAKAFTVARVTNMDVLEDIRGMVNKSLSEGLTFQQFKKELMPNLQKKGWWGITQDENGNDIQLGSVRRLKTIYDTNLRTSYMAGRYKDMAENADNRPYWMYDAKDDSKTRPAHKALDGKVFKYDDPFWDTHYPPNGWHCRCNVIALNEQNLKEKDLVIEDTKDKFSKEIKLVSGQEKTVTTFKTVDKAGNPIKVSTDAGWDYNVGKAAFQPDLDNYEYKTAKQYCQGIVTGEPFKVFYKQSQTKANPLVKLKLTDSQLRQEIFKISSPDNYMSVGILNNAEKKLLNSNSQVVKLSEPTFIKQQIRHADLSIEDYIMLPTIMDKAQLVVRDGDLSMVYVLKGKNIYYAAIKTTKNLDELYLLSFRKLSENKLDKYKEKAIKKGYEVIKDDI
ncbi:MAG: phage minor head protein [Candidatus Gastranaerophilales bacterium]|nr:phage minor head protein [Candidatus Gastranaerophilales bacterium]